jgi:hypothetical protein
MLIPFLVAWFVGYVVLVLVLEHTMWSLINVCFELDPSFGVELALPCRTS